MRGEEERVKEEGRDRGKENRREGKTGEKESRGERRGANTGQNNKSLCVCVCVEVHIYPKEGVSMASQQGVRLGFVLTVESVQSKLILL